MKQKDVRLLDGSYPIRMLEPNTEVIVLDDSKQPKKSKKRRRQKSR